MATEPTPSEQGPPPEQTSAVPPASVVKAEAPPSAVAPTNAPVAAQPPTPVADAAPEEDDAPPTWPIKADIAILVMLLILSFFLASFTATNSDVWSHLAMGKRYSEGKFEFGVDPFAWSTEAHAGKPAVYWVNHSWLYSWLVYGIFSLFGGPGLILFKAILFTAAVALLSRIGWNEANRWFLLLCLVMGVLAASTRLLMQPIVVSMLFVSITLFVLDRVGVFAFKREEGEPDRTHWLWYLPPLFALWANLDQYFLLGPLLVGLCWGATCLGQWFPSAEGVPTTTLGQVFGVALAACVLNPHHVHVFQLPVELAYLLLSITDSVGVPLPNALVGAGRTLKELSQTETGMSWAMSALSPGYWDPLVGMHVAGMAVFPLLAFGLVSFTLVALVKQQEGAPTLHAGRFILWLVFAILALAMHRLIPFFALVAAPLTAMTLGEFVNWQHVCNEDAAERRDRGLYLARIASLPFMLLLLGFAWPGWLNVTAGANEWNAPRRVRWELRPDPSLKKTAESLQALKAQGKAENVFNNSLELGNLMQWFAPEVKYCLDSRLALYAGQTAAFDRARIALGDPDQPQTDWQDLFRERKVNQVALSLMRSFANHHKQAILWWTDADHWQERYVDNRILLFSWSGPGRTWPANESLQDLNRRAFGEVAEADRPPVRGAPAPVPPSSWSLFFDGLGPTPAHVGEGMMLQERFGAHSFWRGQADDVVTLVTCAATSGSTIGYGARFSSILKRVARPPAGDAAPPALLILPMRAARRAVAENPLDPDAYKLLLTASSMLRDAQEDFWIGIIRTPRMKHPSGLRDRMRQTQRVASVYHAVQLQPDSPELHEELAKIYMQQSFLDLALEHAQLAFEAHKSRLLAGKYGQKNPKDQEAALKKYSSEMVEPIDKSVRRRLAAFKTGAAMLTPLQRVPFALFETHEEFDARGGIEKTPLGLAKKARELLDEIDEKSLGKDEIPLYLRLRFDLLLSIGEVKHVKADIEQPDVRKVVSPVELAEFGVYVYGALGDYASMDQALLTIEKALQDPVRQAAENLKAARSVSIVATFISPSLESSNVLAGRVMMRTAPFGVTDDNKPAYLEFGRLRMAIDIDEKLANDYYNAKTLRGILALEAGDTKRARAVFDETLKEAGDRFFSDRRIAKRYLELLNEQAR
ncbi:MAG: hypothetical protein FJ303_22615 [Planctomycetes bacterium]|nr:hypothetical protein [Planctomycetota bacterium]